MTHLRAKELLGKKAFGNDGRLLGEVVGIADRRGRVKAVVLRGGPGVMRQSAHRRPRLRVLH